MAIGRSTCRRRPKRCSARCNPRAASPDAARQCRTSRLADD
jgi:hypothetical protein